MNGSRKVPSNGPHILTYNLWLNGFEGRAGKNMMAATESISEIQTQAIKGFISRLLTKASKKPSDLLLSPEILPFLLFRFVWLRKKPVQSDF